jgi:hypothetical protein
MEYYSEVEVLLTAEVVFQLVNATSSRTFLNGSGRGNDALTSS